MPISNKKYCHGILFLFGMMLVSCANDVMAKFMGQRINPTEIIFFRFFFSLVTLIPLAIRRKSQIAKTTHIKFNCIRGVLGAISFYMYTYALTRIALVEVVIIMWSIPLFGVALSTCFLGENVSPRQWLATIIGFVGLAFIMLYDHQELFSLKIVYIIPVISAFLFATQDIMIKKMVTHREDAVTMLFYFAAITSALTFVPATLVWQMPTAFEWCLLLMFGLLANLMQYFIFMAFSATDMSALAPYRYMEFFLSSLAGYVFFAEVPGINIIVGAIILVPSTLYLALVSEIKRVTRTTSATTHTIATTDAQQKRRNRQINID